jgi:hypothetical protein
MLAIRRSFAGSVIVSWPASGASASVSTGIACTTSGGAMSPPTWPPATCWFGSSLTRPT